MAVFTYKAYNESGGVYHALIEAATVIEAKERLFEKGIQLVSLKEKKRTYKKKIPLSHLLSFTKDLAELLEADLPLFESLTLLKEQTLSDTLRDHLYSILQDLESGLSFSEALKKHPTSFSTLYSTLVHVGEQSGHLSLSLKKIVEEVERQNKLLKQIKSALLYPALLLVFCTLLIHLIIFYLVPSLHELIDSEKGHVITRMVIKSSNHLRSFEWLYLLGFIGCAILLKLYFKRGLIDQLVLKIPKLRDFIIEHALLKFSSTMEILISGGIPLVDSLKLTKSLITNAPIQSVFTQITKKVEEGHKLSQELKKYPLFPPLFSRLLLIGENSGELSKSFSSLSSHYQESVEKKLKKLMTLLSPLLLLIIGVLIGLIMLGILIPLTDINSLSL